MAMSGSGKPDALAKSLALLPKLEGAPLPDWAKKTKGAGMKKSESAASISSLAGVYAPPTLASPKPVQLDVSAFC